MMSRRSRRNNHFKEDRSNGWGMNLYRNKRNGMIGGVCAGLADHFEFAPWVVRLVFLGGLLFFQSLAVIGYIVACVLISPRPKGRRDDFEEEPRDRSRKHGRKNMFNYQPSPSSNLHRAQERLNATLRKVEDMEAYVTSRQYKLNKEFANIDR
jgi:phage shock protein C